jgi:hypothetical protein
MGLARGWLMSLRLISGGFDSIHSKLRPGLRHAIPSPGTTQCPKRPRCASSVGDGPDGDRLAAQGSPGLSKVTKCPHAHDSQLKPETTHAPLPATTFRPWTPGIGDCSRLASFSEGVPSRASCLLLDPSCPPNPLPRSLL